MKKLLTTAILATMAVPVFADEQPESAPRVEQFERLIITAQKDEPATTRVRELEVVKITAAKGQPDDYVVNDRIAALLAEIETEE